MRGTSEDMGYTILFDFIFHINCSLVYEELWILS